MYTSHLSEPFVDVPSSALRFPEPAEPLDVDLRLHFFLPRSQCHGPGLRSVVWFQGCSIGCPGCLNRSSHSPFGGFDARVGEIVHRIATSSSPIEGITLTGGEPFDQPTALLALLLELERLPELSVLLSTGHTLREVEAFAVGAQALERVDAVIAGPFIGELSSGNSLRGSWNRRVHTFGDRLPYEDVIDSCR